MIDPAIEIPEKLVGAMEPNTGKKAHNSRVNLLGRTNAWWKELGFEPWTCEYTTRVPGVPHPVSKDLYGFVDIVAVNPKVAGTWYIQVTTGDHAAERIEKSKSNPLLARIIAPRTGNRFLVHSFRKNKKANRWVIRLSFIVVTPNGLQVVEVDADEFIQEAKSWV